MELAVRLILGAILAGAALSKLAAPRAGAAAMATYGFRSPASRWSTFSIVVAAELILAVGVVAGSDTAAYAAAALMALFATTLASALMQGRAGEPCGCFGSESKVSGLAVARNGALAVALAAIPTLPASLSNDGWLTAGLVAALAVSVALAVTVLALAREVGMLRLRLGPAGALEIAHEGPEVGGRTGLVERSAEVAALGAEDGEVFSESSDSDVWEALGIPGSPYAIAVERDGTVGAKGTFNNLAQLESILATAKRRRSERHRIDALSV